MRWSASQLLRSWSAPLFSPRQIVGFPMWRLILYCCCECLICRLWITLELRFNLVLRYVIFGDMNGCGIIIHVLKRERLLSVLSVCELEKQMTASHLGKQAYLRLSRCASVKIRQKGHDIYLPFFSSVYCGCRLSGLPRRHGSKEYPQSVFYWEQKLRKCRSYTQV